MQNILHSDDGRLWNLEKRGWELYESWEKTGQEVDFKVAGTKRKKFCNIGPKSIKRWEPSKKGWN